MRRSCAIAVGAPLAERCSGRSGRRWETVETRYESHPLLIAARRAGVRDARVLEALEAVPRDRFVPKTHESVADRDVPIPIGGEQVTTQPSLLAAMLEALELNGSERVLEVGTGLGYQAAILGRLAGEVWSIERRPELADAAMANLAREGVSNVRVLVGDGSEGLPGQAPYDAIIIAAAHPLVPPPLAAQLAEGGRLVQPIGPSGGDDVTLFRLRAGRLVRDRVVIGAHFVPLYGRYGFTP
jgi:protein-L-isoaspartate(D-aspartate) O-methyltransferase